MNKVSENISPLDQILDKISRSIRENNKVRGKFSPFGKVSIDRLLPFICIYRNPLERADPGTEMLITGLSSYFIVSYGAPPKPLSKLIEAIVKQLSASFGSCLILEIWSAEEDMAQNPVSEETPRPPFTIFNLKKQKISSTLDILKRTLEKIKTGKVYPLVNVQTVPQIKPADQNQLLSEKKLLKLNAFLIGLKISPFFRDEETQEIFPVRLRNYKRKFLNALNRTFHEFMMQNTSLRPPSFQSLGKRALVKAVWDIDQKMTKIAQSFDFLLQVTPNNVEQEWQKFKQQRYRTLPEFNYRPNPFDPVLLKKDLYNIPMQRIEDPTVEQIFLGKLDELDRILTLLKDRGTSRFLHGSLQLYGPLHEDLLKSAKIILRKISSRADLQEEKENINAKVFARHAEKEIKTLAPYCNGFLPQVFVRNDISGLIVSQGNLLIGSTTKVAKSRMDALIQHEVGTHIVTYINGLSQPFKLLSLGLKGYEELQEGIAVLSEYLSGGFSKTRLRFLAGHVVAGYSVAEGADFLETFSLLQKTYGFSPKNAYLIAMRVHRGGGYVKDVVYLRGLKRILEYIQKGGNFETLFNGKFAFNHVPFIKELLYRKVLEQPKLLPNYLKRSDAQERLKKVKEGLSLMELV